MFLYTYALLMERFLSPEKFLCKNGSSETAKESNSSLSCTSEKQ